MFKAGSIWIYVFVAVHGRTEFQLQHKEGPVVFIIDSDKLAPAAAAAFVSCLLLLLVLLSGCVALRMLPLVAAGTAAI
jgi:hypothetical protein